jgi:1,4-alpha-glucan branching enzyme
MNVNVEQMAAQQVEADDREGRRLLARAVAALKASSGGVKSMVTKRKFKDKIRVTFTLPARAGEESVHLVGDFNRSDRQAAPMTRNQFGDWEVRLDLAPDREHQFRYLANGQTWRNDPAADGDVRNPFGSDNSLVSPRISRRAPRRRKAGG